MQTPEWAAVKSKYGWKFDSLTVNKHIIISYRRSIPGVGTLRYIPGLSGITTPEISTLTSALKKLYKSRGFAVRLELNQPHDNNDLQEYKRNGWKLASNHVQYRHTIAVELSYPLDDIWMSFKSRGRYEILQAQKAGIKVKDMELTDDNLDAMYELMQVTSVRNKFFIRDKQFTMEYWRTFAATGKLKLFFAYHNDELLAGSMILLNGRHAWNKDGGSVRSKANLMAPRLLQWEIMKKLKKQGIETYDLGGIPSPDSFAASSISGIYVFKSAFSKKSLTLMPTLELPLSSRYALWPKAEKQWLRIYNLFAHNLWW